MTASQDEQYQRTSYSQLLQNIISRGVFNKVRLEGSRSRASHQWYKFCNYTIRVDTSTDFLQKKKKKKNIFQARKGNKV